MACRKSVLGLASIVFFVLIVAIAQGQTTRSFDYYGRVVGSDGKPIQGAAASLVQYHQETRAYATSATATTDANGKFHVTGIDASISSAIAVVRVPGLGVAGGQLQDSSEDSPTEIKVKPSTELRIRFVTADGNAVAGLKVWPEYISEVGGNSYIQVAPEMRDQFAQTTDADGVCVFKEIPRNSTLQYAFADSRFANPTSQDSITIAASPSNDVVTRTLQPGGSIAGKITFADTGQPVPGISVTASWLEPIGDNRRITSSASTTTDADGNYAFKGMRAAQYSVRLQLQPAQSAKYAPPGAPTFALGPAEHLTGKDIALVSGAIVTGKVSAAGTGAPVPGARIIASSSVPTTRPADDVLQATLRTADGQTVFLDDLITSNLSQVSAMTGDDGTYVVHVMPGQVQITLSAAPIGYQIPRPAPATRPAVTAAARGVTIVSAAAARTTQVSIAENQTVTKDFELEVDPVPPTKIQVVDSAGKPMSGATIYFELSGPRTVGTQGAPTQARSDSEGSYVARSVPIGTSLRARKGNLGTASKVIVSDSNRNELKLTLQKDTLASAAVQVADPTGKPVPEAQISIMQRMGTLLMGVPGGTTADDGKFVASSLFPDMTYTITGRAKGFGMGTMTLPQLQPGKQLDAKLQLIKADSFVSGMVLDENQLPMTNVEVFVGAPRTNSQTVRTDITGHFRADGIAAGDNVTVYSRVGNVRGQAQPERVLAGTSDMILIHNPTAVPQAGQAARGGVLVLP